jgi:hypothetical protein
MDLPISIGIFSIYIIGVRRHKESDLNDISIKPTNPDLNADIITYMLEPCLPQGISPTHTLSHLHHYNIFNANSFTKNVF